MIGTHPVIADVLFTVGLGALALRFATWEVAKSSEPWIVRAAIIAVAGLYLLAVVVNHMANKPLLNLGQIFEAARQGAHQGTREALVSQPVPEIKPCVPETLKFVPPKEHKLVRYDDTFVVPSYVLCPQHGISDEARIACLCPNRVPYTLRSMDAPRDGNYETEITIHKVCNPMYKLRVYFRDLYYKTGSVFTASPYTGDTPGVILVAGLFKDDMYSIGLTSTAPEDSFKISVITSTGLRVICINQEN